MRQIKLDEVGRLLTQAEAVYELGQAKPSADFDIAVDELIRSLDALCASLEEVGRDAANARETVGIENIHRAVRMTDAAIGAIETVRRYYGWEYSGVRLRRQQRFQEDVNVEGLWTLKVRFEELMLQMRYERVRAIVRNVLAERFSEDEFVFEPIVVTRTDDKFGDGSIFLRILIVFDGNGGQLDPTWTSGFRERIRTRLVAADIEEFPSVSFIEKSEWWESYTEAHLRNPEETRLVEFPS